MKKQVTLKQIAKELDISISTVSKAIKNNKEISKETREKVQAFAKFYNYRPNQAALNLRQQSTKNIGVIIPEIVHYFFTTVIKGIEKVANANGYNVIVCVSGESFEKEVISMQTLINGSIDGFIISPSLETQAKKDYHHLSEVVEQGMPLVMFDTAVEDIVCDKVIIDDTQAAFEAVDSLLKIGCRKIGLITTPDYVGVGRLRRLGYEKALKAKGIPIDPDMILKIWDIENSAEIIAGHFHPEKFDGVFAVNEYFAIMAMKKAQKRGFEIPHDISFIGFTDGILSKCATPTLSTVAQHGLEMGEVAARMLIERLEDKEIKAASITQIIKTTLVQRESTKREN